MKRPDEPLEYPAHYPPTDRWKKFFIGVRGLGPDISFFKDLKAHQASRTSDCMKMWGTKQELDLATIFGNAFQKWLRWPTPYFLPQDKLNTIVGGPKFDQIDSGELDDALVEIEQELHAQLPPEFWQKTRAQTLGELVVEVIETLKAA